MIYKSFHPWHAYMTKNMNLWDIKQLIFVISMTSSVTGNQKLKLMSVKPLKEQEAFLCYFSLLEIEELRTKKALINSSLKIFGSRWFQKKNPLYCLFSGPVLNLPGSKRSLEVSRLMSDGFS